MKMGQRSGMRTKPKMHENTPNTIGSGAWRVEATDLMWCALKARKAYNKDHMSLLKGLVEGGHNVPGQGRPDRTLNPADAVVLAMLQAIYHLLPYTDPVALADRAESAIAADNAGNKNLPPKTEEGRIALMVAAIGVMAREFHPKTREVDNAGT